jgi:Cof subfamily protein (haloacid dehalogenase superfamily)
MAPRLVVFDLDGTVLGADNRLSAHTAEVLARARAAGLTLVAASGRSRWAAELVLSRTGAIDYAICSNGAVLYHRPTRTIRRRQEIEPRLLRRVYDDVRRAVDGMCWAWETERGVVADRGFRVLGTEAALDELLASEDLDLPEGDAQPVDERLRPFGPTVRILLANPDLPRDELVNRLDPLVPEVRLSSSSAVFVEVTAPDVDKAAELRAFCERYGFGREEVVAFGDHHNDLAMLQWAGRGIAVRNAHPEVLAAIDEHTEATNDQDGVAEVIEKLITNLPPAAGDHR